MTPVTIMERAMIRVLCAVASNPVFRWAGNWRDRVFEATVRQAIGEEPITLSKVLPWRVRSTTQDLWCCPETSADNPTPTPEPDLATGAPRSSLDRELIAAKSLAEAGESK